jgi:hypothetical protein
VATRWMKTRNPYTCRFRMVYLVQVVWKLWGGGCNPRPSPVDLVGMGIGEDGRS